MRSSASSSAGGLWRGNRDFRWFWLARALSLTGDGIAVVALVLYVKDQEESGFAVAGLLLAQTLPRTLGPLLGVAADRFDRRAVMLGCEIAQAMVYGAIALLQPGYAAVLVLIAGAATLQTTFLAASRAAVPTIVGREQLPSANALLGAAVNLYLSAGPFLAGVLVAWTDVRGALVANAISFAASAGALVRTGRLHREPHGSVPVSGGVLEAAREGVRHAARVPVVRTILVALFFAVAFLSLENVALVFLVEDVLDGGSTAYALTLAAFGVGLGAGSLSLLVPRLSRASPALFAAGLGIGAVGTGATGVAPVLAVAIAGQLVAGIGNGLANVVAETTIQREVHADLLGRVFGLLATTTFVAAGCAYALGGPLLELTSARTVFLVASAGALVTAAAAAVAGRTPSGARA